MTDAALLASFKLAEILGMTVSDLSEKMTITELNGWIAYFKLRDKQNEP